MDGDKDRGGDGVGDRVKSGDGVGVGIETM